jgi:hypothetical protein
MEHAVELPARELWAAQMFTATDTRRPYLQCIHFAANGDMVATDGNTMFVSRPAVDLGVPMPVNLRIFGTINRSDITARIRFLDEYHATIELLNNKRRVRTVLAAQSIKVTYPDYTKPLDHGPNVAQKRFAVNPRYLNLPAKIWPEGIAVNTYGPQAPMVIEPLGPVESCQDATVIVMPMRDE